MKLLFLHQDQLFYAEQDKKIIQETQGFKLKKHLTMNVLTETLLKWAIFFH